MHRPISLANSVVCYTPRREKSPTRGSFAILPQHDLRCRQFSVTHCAGSVYWDGWSDDQRMKHLLLVSLIAIRDDKISANTVWEALLDIKEFRQWDFGTLMIQ